MKKNNLILLTSYYKTDKIHQLEIDECILRNLDNRFISDVIVFTTVDLPFCLKSRTKNIKLQNRFRFLDAFHYANKYLKGKKILLSNSDIFFDDSLYWLNFIDFRNLFILLTRRDYLKGKIIEKRVVIGEKDSHLTLPTLCHDSWVFQSPLPDFKSDFYLGATGCEHSLVCHALKAGMQVINVYDFIYSYHIHANNFRAKRLRHVPPCYNRIEAAKKLPLLFKFLI